MDTLPLVTQTLESVLIVSTTLMANTASSVTRDTMEMLPMDPPTIVWLVHAHSLRPTTLPNLVMCQKKDNYSNVTANRDTLETDVIDVLLDTLDNPNKSEDPVNHVSVTETTT